MFRKLFPGFEMQQHNAHSVFMKQRGCARQGGRVGLKGLEIRMDHRVGRGYTANC